MLLLTCGCFEQAEVTTGQTDSDRIADINHVASIMEEYKGLYGKYPLYESWENGRYQPTVYIRITDHALSDDERFMPGVTCTSLTKAFFEDYLSKHLHRTIKLPVDERPLNVSEGYQFVFDGKDYFISCTLEKATDRTRRLAHGVHKYQLSSTSIPDRKIFKIKKKTNQALCSRGYSPPKKPLRLRAHPRHLPTT